MTDRPSQDTRQHAQREQALNVVAAQLDEGDRKGALAALRRALPDLVEEAGFARDLVATLQRHGTRASALACVNLVRDSLPKDSDLALFRVELLTRLGKIETARRVMRRLASEGDKPAYWQRRLALDIGADQLSLAIEAAQEARAAAQDGPGLRHAEVKALIAAEDFGTAAEKLALALATFPDNPRLSIQEVHLAKARDGAHAALPLAREVAERFPDALHARLALADCLRASGDRATAIQELTRTAEAFPRSALPHVRLARTCLELARRDEALGHITTARALDGGTMPVEMAYADVMTRLGRTEDAISRLEWLVGNEQVTPPLLVKLINGHLAMGQTTEADSYARMGLEKFPGSATLFENLLSHAIDAAPETALRLIEAGEAAGLPPSRRDSLLARLALGALDTDAALARARRKSVARRDAADVNLIARILIQSGRLTTAQRYLRLALARWSAEPALVSLFAQASNRLGLASSALEFLLTMGLEDQPRSPAILSNLMLLHAARGDADPALVAFHACLAEGGFPQQNAYRLLLRCLVADGQADRMSRLIDAQQDSGLWSHPHLQKTFQGQLLTEIKIALASGEDGPARITKPDDPEGHAALIVENPDSNVAAMRVLRVWMRADRPRAASSGNAIPPVIHQYWDKKLPPDRIGEMIATWQSAPGFDHQLHNRQTALSYLREHCGPDALRAFRMARNPAEEADLLRLYLLSQEGGIYADADDRLHGALERLLPGDAGLVVLLEPGLANVANNFIAAVAGHPILREAAEMATEALIARSTETAWSKTGPGLLTRAIARTLGRHLNAGTNSDVAFLPLAELAGVISIHNPAEHKRAANDWRGNRGSSTPPAFVSLLEEQGRT